MNKMLIAAAFAALVLAGCSAPAPTETTTENPSTQSSTSTHAVQVAYDLGSIKKGDKAHCVICSADGKDHGEEAAAETIDFEGKTYAFCSETEKAEFISDPAKYVKK